MQVNIKATKLDLTEQIKDYVQKKTDMLEKYLGDFPAVHADFEVGRESNHHAKGEVYKAEFNLHVPGELLRVEKIEEDLYKAIDKVKEHMEMAIKKYKEKKFGK
jgi:putative sigma-54 modulation protein